MLVGSYEKMGCYDDLNLSLHNGDDMVTKETESCSICEASERFCCCCLESDWLRGVATEIRHRRPAVLGKLLRSGQAVQISHLGLDLKSKGIVWAIFGLL